MRLPGDANKNKSLQCFAVGPFLLSDLLSDLFAKVHELFEWIKENNNTDDSRFGQLLIAWRSNVLGLKVSRCNRIGNLKKPERQSGVNQIERHLR